MTQAKTYEGTPSELAGELLRLPDTRKYRIVLSSGESSEDEDEGEIETPRSQTSQQRAKSFRDWADSHSRSAPLLSDEAISRERIYGERG